jgi:hypothetical protein
MLEAVRQSYWRTRRTVKKWYGALLGGDATFRKIVLSDQFRSPRAIKPILGETATRAAAAVRWLGAAQDATADGGVSYGYFPDSSARGWDISYPETTGYIMTSLVRYARKAGRPDLVDRAYRMALWEADIQMSSGAVQGGKVAAPDRQTPAAFNTGMVLDGLLTVLEERSDTAIQRAAERAAAFLSGDLNDRGLFATNGAFVSRDSVKVYNVLCAWALHRFARISGDARWRDAAIRAVEGALAFQNERGWFAENCLTDPVHPLTHTIGYTAQGVLEVGVEAEREDFVAAAEACIKGVIDGIRANGFLPGRFDDEWRPAVRWSCLTGSAQIAIVAYRLAALRGVESYAAAAGRLVGFLKAVQRTTTGNAGIDGALAGAYPIMGDYMTGGYPNWATKYLLDALMAEAERRGEVLTREGSVA